MYHKLIATEPKKASILQYEDRLIKEDEVKVKIEFATPKHGSELAAFRGESPHDADYYDEDWHAFLPREKKKSEQTKEWNLGNQWVGRIVETGKDVTTYKIGDRVCGYGGIRDTHIVKAVNTNKLLSMPEGMSWQNAVCYDPAQFALGGVRDSGVRLGDRVAVFGLGAIGQLAVQMLKLSGASYVAAIDPIEKRRELALKTGADAVFDPVTQDVGMELKKATDKLGVDVIIETSANEVALQQSLRGLAYGGTLAFVGWARAFKGGLDLGREAHFNNAKIVFSRACSEPNPDYPRWNWQRLMDECWNLLKDGKLQCEGIIDPVVPLSEAAEGYQIYVDQHPELSIKLGVKL